ncbi:calcium-binding tyrosine phosphorylation-regulated protein-like [Hipposideros larvatus]
MDAPSSDYRQPDTTISSKPRLLTPYGLDIVLQGLSRAILETNPQNITKFAAFYFEELIAFREGNASLDIKNLIKQFHRFIVEKWSEGTTQENKQESVKEPRETPRVSQELTWMEKSIDTEEDNTTGPLFSNKIAQFPSVRAEQLPEPEETSEAVRGPSEPSTSKITTSPSSLASSLPLQDGQELPAYDQALEIPLQAGTEVTSTIHKTYIYKDELMTEGATYVEQIPEQIAIPLTNHIACLKENELLPPGSLIPVGKRATCMSEKCAGSTKFAHLQHANYDSSVHMMGKETLLLSVTSMKGPPAQALDTDGSTKAKGYEKPLLLEVEVTSLLPGSKSQKRSASQKAEVTPVLPGEAAKAVQSSLPVRSSSGPPPPVPETKPEWEAAPERGLVEPDAKNEAV